MSARRQPVVCLRFALGLSLASLVACGGNAPPAQTPPARAHEAPPVASVPDAPPLLVEYVVFHRKWVERLAPASPPDVDAWSRAPENAAAVSGNARHILFKVPGGEKDPGLAAKKKAQAALDRLKQGEDFGKVAKQLSEDAASKDSGGEYPADRVKELPPPVASAFAALAPGETSAPVRSADGWHIVRKERASDDRIESAYRKSKAPELTKRLGDELLERFKANMPARAAIAEAVLAVLGERGASDASRPTASVVDRDRLKQVRLPAAAKAAIETFAHGARPGEALPSPAIDGDAVVVARARATAAAE